MTLGNSRERGGVAGTVAIVLHSGTVDILQAAATVATGAVAMGREVRGSKTDIPAWTSKAGHRLLAVEDEEGYARFVVRTER